MSRSKLVNGGLAASAVATLALAGLAMSGFSLASTQTPSTAVPASASPSSAGKASPSSAESPATATSSAESSSSPSASASAIAVVPLKRLPADRAASLVVLGDDTSNETREWVNELGAAFGQTRSTSVRRINQVEPKNYNDPIRYGSTQPALSVWNASADSPVVLDDGNAAAVLTEQPDLVLISRGHGADKATVVQELQQTAAAVRAAHPDVPVVVVLQPVLASDDSAALAAVSSWAAESGLPVVNVAKVFEAKGDDGFVLDGKLTEAGQRLWATAVHNAIAPR